MANAMIFTLLIIFSILALCNSKIMCMRETRVVNGTNYKPGEIINQVFIYPKMESWKSHGFGGTLLNEYFVITSAWNLKKSAKDYFIIMPGDSDSNTTIMQSLHRGQEIIVHENYTGTRLGQHDIALIKVTPPFNLSHLVNRVELSETSDNLHINDEAIVSGWARKWVTGPLTEKLKKSYSRISDSDDCFKKYSILGYFLYREIQFCTFGEPNGPCNHDSGDPLMKNGKLIGISASGYSCDHSNFPSVYTNVIPYLDWIKNYTTLNH